MRIHQHSWVAFLIATLLLAATHVAQAQVDSLAAHLAAGRAVVEGIRFVGNTDRITAESGVHIERLANLLAVRPDTFLIEGHTNTTGTPGVDQALSEKRAAVVKSRLMAAGVSGKRLFVAGFGATRPPTVSRGETASRRPDSARIEVVRVSQEAVGTEPEIQWSVVNPASFGCTAFERRDATARSSQLRKQTHDRLENPPRTSARSATAIALSAKDSLVPGAISSEANAVFIKIAVDYDHSQTPFPLLLRGAAVPIFGLLEPDQELVIAGFGNPDGFVTCFLHGQRSVTKVQA